MNHRDRTLAAMPGQPVDHLSFIARMDLWYTCHRHGSSFSPPYEGASSQDLQCGLGSEELFEAVAPRDRYTLGFGDKVPSDALFGRIRPVVEFWAERGIYPLPAHTSGGWREEW